MATAAQSKKTATKTAAKKGSPKKSVAKAVKQVKAETKKAQEKARKFQTVAPPHVDSAAEILAMRKVKKARVIVAEGARYRGCEISGTLELAPDRDPQYWRNGDLRAQVVMRWFDWSPESGFLSVAFPEGTYEVKENYTGEVIEAIGR
jgi:hypothetical protein